MVDSALHQQLIHAISDLHEEQVMNLVRWRLAEGDDPIMIIEATRKACVRWASDTRQENTSWRH